MSSSFDSRDPFDDGFVRDVDKGPVHADFVPHEEDHPHAFCLDDKGKEKYNEFPCNQDGLFAVSFGIVMGVLAVGAHGPGPPSSPRPDAGLPCTDVMDPAVPPSACGGEAYPNEDKAAAISRSMAHGGEAYPNAYKAAAIPRSTESSVTSVEVV